MIEFVMTNEECWIRCIVIVKNSAEKRQKFFPYTRPEDLMQKYLSRHTGSVDFGYRDAGSVWIEFQKQQ